MKVRGRFAAAAIIAGALAVAADNMGKAQTNLVIGLLLPPEEPQAASVREGVALGVEQANKTDGANVRLVIRGRVGQWGADGVEAARMVLDDGAQGLIAPPDGAASHLALQVSGRTAVPVISLCADSSVTQTGIPWMARMVPGTIDEAKAIFAFARGKRWMAIVPNDHAGRQIAQDLNAAAKAGGCELGTAINLQSFATNWAAVQSRILADRPDAILVWVDPAAAATIAKTLRAAGFSGLLGGPSWLNSAGFVAATVDGFVIPVPVVDRECRARLEKFTADYRSRFGHEPDAMATMSHDAACLLVRVLRQAGDRPAREMFPLCSSFFGASGILNFDAQGNRQVEIRAEQSRGGRFVPVESKMPEAQLSEAHP